MYCQEETDELKKKVAVLECQLRKSEAARKSFEMSTGKLLSFVEVKKKRRQVFISQTTRPELNSVLSPIVCRMSMSSC